MEELKTKIIGKISSVLDKDQNMWAEYLKSLNMLLNTICMWTQEEKNKINLASGDKDGL